MRRDTKSRRKKRPLFSLDAIIGRNVKFKIRLYGK